MSSSGFSVPVLLVTFNRLECTLKVIDGLRRVKPSKLYISSDGPRNKSEMMVVLDVRERIETAIDWPCTISRLYRAENVGCKKAVSGSIDWFFTYEESGIILEDDCVPGLDFFLFSERALLEFRDDMRVSMVAGSRFTPAGNVYLSKYCMIWGWATWKDRWQGYESDLKLTSGQIRQFSAYFSGGWWLERLYWAELFKRLVSGRIPSAWDFQFLYYSFSKGRYSIVPPVNLISNIGTGDLATNNTAISKVNNLPIESLPSGNVDIDQLIVSECEDRLVFRNFFCSGWVRLLKRYIKKCLRKN